MKKINYNIYMEGTVSQIHLLVPSFSFYIIKPVHFGKECIVYNKELGP